MIRGQIFVGADAHKGKLNRNKGNNRASSVWEFVPNQKFAVHLLIS